MDRRLLACGLHRGAFSFAAPALVRANHRNHFRAKFRASTSAAVTLGAVQAKLSSRRSAGNATASAAARPAPGKRFSKIDQVAQSL